MRDINYHQEPHNDSKELFPYNGVTIACGTSLKYIFRKNGATLEIKKLKNSPKHWKMQSLETANVEENILKMLNQIFPRALLLPQPMNHMIPKMNLHLLEPNLVIQPANE